MANVYLTVGEAATHTHTHTYGAIAINKSPEMELIGTLDFVHWVGLYYLVMVVEALSLVELKDPCRNSSGK